MPNMRFILVLVGLGAVVRAVPAHFRDDLEDHSLARDRMESHGTLNLDALHYPGFRPVRKRRRDDPPLLPQHARAHEWDGALVTRDARALEAIGALFFGGARTSQAVGGALTNAIVGALDAAFQDRMGAPGAIRRDHDYIVAAERGEGNVVFFPFERFEEAMDCLSVGARTRRFLAEINWF